MIFQNLPGSKKNYEKSHLGKPTSSQILEPRTFQGQNEES